MARTSASSSASRASASAVVAPLAVRRILIPSMPLAR